MKPRRLQSDTIFSMRSFFGSVIKSIDKFAYFLYITMVILVLSVYRQTPVVSTLEDSMSMKDSLLPFNEMLLLDGFLILVILLVVYLLRRTRKCPTPRLRCPECASQKINRESWVRSLLGSTRYRCQRCFYEFYLD